MWRAGAVFAVLLLTAVGLVRLGNAPTPSAPANAGFVPPSWTWQYEAAQKWFSAGEPAKAIPLLEEAAAAGQLEALTELGHAYYLGRGVVQNFELAVAQFQQAARRGSAEAQYMLEICYRKGHGVLQNYARAYAWFNLASAQGHALATQARQELGNTLSPEIISLGQKLSLQLSAEAASPAPGVPIGP